jgi:hypothetical protein
MRRIVGVLARLACGWVPRSLQAQADASATELRAAVLGWVQPAMTMAPARRPAKLDAADGTGRKE